MIREFFIFLFKNNLHKNIYERSYISYDFVVCHMIFNYTPRMILLVR